MSYRDKKRGDNDKYLRLTGMWQSKNNAEMWSGKMKVDQLDELFDKVETAKDADAPVIFFLWENMKRKGKRDPEFTLQCCVGDSEESPRSRRESRNDREEEEEKPRRKSQREEPKEEPEEEPEEEQGEEEEEPKRKSTRKGSPATKSSKRDSSW